MTRSLASFAAAIAAVATAGMSYGDDRAVPEEYLGIVTGAVALDEFAGVHCEECFESSSSHVFVSGACGTVEDPSCMDCHTFNSCHTGPQPGACAEFHRACHGADGFALESGIIAGDLRAVQAMLKNSMGKLTVNAARRAVQVADCHGHLVGHYPIPAEWAIALLGDA